MAWTTLMPINWFRWNYLFALLWFILAHLSRVEFLIKFCLICFVIHGLLMVIMPIVAALTRD